MHARDMLNAMKWHYHDLDRATIWYRHYTEGNPGENAVFGARVERIGPSFIEFPTEDGKDTTHIPYHRVLRIEVDGKVVWSR